MGTDLKAKPLVCKLTTAEFKARKRTVLAEIKNKIQDRKELANGFQYSFEGTDDMLDTLTLFVKTERQCCDFFHYQLSIAGHSHEQTGLKITGPAGAKRFITEELGL